MSEWGVTGTWLGGRTSVVGDDELRNPGIGHELEEEQAHVGLVEMATDFDGLAAVDGAPVSTSPHDPPLFVVSDEALVDRNQRAGALADGDLSGDGSHVWL